MSSSTSAWNRSQNLLVCVIRFMNQGKGWLRLILMESDLDPSQNHIWTIFHPIGISPDFTGSLSYGEWNSYLELLATQQGMDSARAERHYQVVQAGSMERFVPSSEVYFRTSAPLWSGWKRPYQALLYSYRRIRPCHHVVTEKHSPLVSFRGIQ